MSVVRVLTEVVQKWYKNGTKMVQKWYTYLEINITAKDNNAPAKAVFQENCLK